MTETSTKKRFFYISEVLFQQILAVFVLLILWELFKSDTYGVSERKTWHIILCALGIALCMAEGVQIYRKESIVTFGETREDRRKAHLLVMCLGFLSITTGIALKISEKVDASRDHFATTHAKLGLSAWIISFVAAIGGLLAFTMKSLPKVSPKVVKIVHLIVGVTAYVLGVVTLVYGLEYLFPNQNRGWVAMVVLLAIYVVYSLIGPCLSIFNYIKRS